MAVREDPSAPASDPVVRVDDADAPLFLAKVAHELRGVVGGLALQAGAIAASVEATSAGGENDALVRSLRELGRRATHLKDLTSDLLDLTRFDPSADRTERVHVATLVADVLGDHTGDGWRDGGEITLRVDEDLAIRTDPVMLRQILSNLIRNARQYGGDDIELVVDRIDGEVRLTVADGGNGLAVGAEAKLFDPFVRGTHAGGDGHGLGLAIVAELAVVLDGVIRYEPNRPTGARFTLALPAD